MSLIIATSTGFVVEEEISKGLDRIISITDDNIVVVEGNLVVSGDLILVGNIITGIKFPMIQTKLEICEEYLINSCGFVEGRDFYCVKDGIIVQLRDKDKYKQ